MNERRLREMAAEEVAVGSSSSPGKVRSYKVHSLRFGLMQLEQGRVFFASSPLKKSIKKQKKR
jgi:hypothetical protein